MCRPASFILTRTDCLFSRASDSHEVIIRENNLSDREPVDFVRVEIAPPDYDYSRPADQWLYKVDQDHVPDWYDPKSAEAACRAMLPAWERVRMVRDGHAEVSDGEFKIFCGSSTGTVNGGKAEFFGSSTGTVNGGKAEFCDSSTGTVNGGKAEFFGSSKKMAGGGK